MIHKDNSSVSTDAGTKHMNNQHSLTTVVCGIVAQTFKAFGGNSDNLTADSGLDNVEGWDSLGHLNIMAEVERYFGIDLIDWNTPTTIGKIVEAIEQKKSEMNNRVETTGDVTDV